MFWGRLQNYGFTTTLPAGRQDEAAFEQGYGFVDLVRRPTARADDLTPQEISVSVPDLIRRIGITGELVPVICTFKIVFQAVRGQLEVKGHRVFKMPPPFAQREIVEAEMKKLMSALQE